MQLSREARQILEILAEECEKNPGSYLNGVAQHALGARIGAYLNNVTFSVAELINAGLASRVYPLDIDSKILITQKGYHYIRPLYRRFIHWLGQHRLLVIVGIIVTIIGIIIGVVNLLT